MVNFSDARVVLLKSAVLICLLSATPLAAQTTAVDPIRLAGTVFADEITGISYEKGGCIVAVAEPVRRSGMAKAGQILVELDASEAALKQKTAEARVLDLEAAVFERQLAIDAAQASVERRVQELELVGKEFARNEKIFRRGLLNETAMEAVESRLMNATFAADQASETQASAVSAKKRAQIALEIGKLDVQSQQVGLDALTLRAPFDGVLLGFDPKVGDCVSAGASAAQIYAPHEKAVEVFVNVTQLVSRAETGIEVGAAVTIARINGETCEGKFTWIGTEADLENQYVKSSIDVNEACAPQLFLNEAVEVERLADPS